MKRFRIDIMDVVMYFVQLLLFVPCLWVLKPFALWLVNQFHWSLRAASWVTAIAAAVLWVVLIMVITFGVMKLRQRPRR